MFKCIYLEWKEARGKKRSGMVRSFYDPLFSLSNGRCKQLFLQLLIQIQLKTHKYNVSQHLQIKQYR